MTTWLKWALVALGCVILLALLAWRWEAAVSVAAAGAVAADRARRARGRADTLRAEVRASTASDEAVDDAIEHRAAEAADMVRESPLPDEGDPTAGARGWLR